MKYIKFHGILEDILNKYPSDLTGFLEQKLKIPEYKAKELAKRLENFNLQRIYEIRQKRLEFSSSEVAKKEDDQIRFNIYSLDNLSGKEFEYFLKWLFEEMDYKVESTRATADSGVDLVVTKNNERVAVQAKRYGRNTKVSNTVVLKTQGGKEIYACDKSIVITTSFFTRYAMEDAKKLNVELWDRYTLSAKIDQINEGFENVKLRNPFPLFKDSLFQSLLNLEKTDLFLVKRKSQDKYYVYRHGIKFPVLSFKVHFNEVSRCVFRIKNNKPVGEYDGYALIRSDRHYRYGPVVRDAYKQITNYLSKFL
jgi:HJR/Mrr/RecB family endonuclease